MPNNVLITGASRGIEFLTAKTLARAGHHVIASMRDVDGANSFNAQQLLGGPQKTTPRDKAVLNP